LLLEECFISLNLTEIGDPEVLCTYMDTIYPRGIHCLLNNVLYTILKYIFVIICFYKENGAAFFFF
jgi:hypothetical protein